MTVSHLTSHLGGGWTVLVPGTATLERGVKGGECSGPVGDLLACRRKCDSPCRGPAGTPPAARSHTWWWRTGRWSPVDDR